MAQKCVHKGCGKVFSDPEEECVYHPGPPVFHEGTKGWNCCKPCVLTFDEFLTIPPCTTGKHSTVDETPAPKPAPVEDTPKPKPIAVDSKPTDTAIPTPPKTSTPQAPEEDSDDPDAPLPPNATCKRRSCGKNSADTPRESPCTYHPGVPIFHEGSKGWTCCKRRVLEFDEFMKIEGCKTRDSHCFVGKRKEEITEVRNDFYQTGNTLIVSYYLKKIEKDNSSVNFEEDAVLLDLVAEGKRFKRRVELWKEIVPDKCTSKILGTKLEMVLWKKEGGLGWPALVKGADTGERIQVGRALRA